MIRSLALIGLLSLAACGPAAYYSPPQLTYAPTGYSEPPPFLRSRAPWSVDHDELMFRLGDNDPEVTNCRPSFNGGFTCTSGNL